MSISNQLIATRNNWLITTLTSTALSVSVSQLNAYLLDNSLADKNTSVLLSNETNVSGTKTII